MKVKSLNHVRFFATPWTVAHQASPSMGFSRQEYWSGLPVPSPGDLLDPRMEARSPALQVEALTSKPPGKPYREQGLTKNIHKGPYIHRKQPWLKIMVIGMKGCCWIMQRHRDSWPPEEKNSTQGQRRVLITQSFCVIKFYKGDRESFWHRHQKGVERVPTC